MANQGYIRYNPVGVATVPQPASTPGSVDPGAGWTTQPYLNFNGDYKRFDDDGNDITGSIQPYQRRDDDGNIVAVQPYQRHDDNNQPV